jgi:hypothetical protein
MDTSQTTEYMAECLWPGVTQADLVALDTRVRAAVTGQGRVRYLGSRLVPSDEVVFCFFEGPSHEAVRSVAVEAAIPFERILEALSYPASCHPR